GDQDHHDRAEPIDVQADRNGQHSGRDRIVQTKRNRAFRSDDVDGGDCAAEGRTDRPGGDLRASVARSLTTDAHDKSGDQWKQRHKQDSGHHHLKVSKTQKPTGMLDTCRYSSVGLYCDRPLSRELPVTLRPIARELGIPPIRDGVTLPGPAASPFGENGPCIIWMSEQRQERIERPGLSTEDSWPERPMISDCLRQKAQCDAHLLVMQS